MCIRDRYQRRVHGEFPIKKMMKVSIVLVLLFVTCFAVKQDSLRDNKAAFLQIDDTYEETIDASHESSLGFQTSASTSDDDDEKKDEEGDGLVHTPGTPRPFDLHTGYMRDLLRSYLSIMWDVDYENLTLYWQANDTLKQFTENADTKDRWEEISENCDHKDGMYYSILNKGMERAYSEWDAYWHATFNESFNEFYEAEEETFDKTLAGRISKDIYMVDFDGDDNWRESFNEMEDAIAYWYYLELQKDRQHPWRAPPVVEETEVKGEVVESERKYAHLPHGNTPADVAAAYFEAVKEVMSNPETAEKWVKIFDKHFDDNMAENDGFLAMFNNRIRETLVEDKDAPECKPLALPLGRQNKGNDEQKKDDDDKKDEQQQRTYERAILYS
eukprot:TRINITY_DN3520_c0_g2_i3.p1 TRINITY_DN3520_c0_g2~~TRINITY_DN3520_c0_g2_i3.p1  ORF type:complete len:387 (-),score=125.77 TRINITY_DN3520_c0_g2_i3:148-1308(-)